MRTQLLLVTQTHKMYAEKKGMEEDLLAGTLKMTPLSMGQKEPEKGVSSTGGDLCTELPDKSIEKCFADTSNIENEVPKETTNVKDALSPSL